MGYGDELLAAGEAEHLYRRDPSRRVSIVDIDRQPRWHCVWADNPILATPEDVAHGEPVQFFQNAPFCRTYIVYPFTEDTGWTFNLNYHAADNIAKVYLSPHERAFGERARAQFGHYVLIEPYTKHPNLRWPFEYWCALVAARPDLTWVQHTHAAAGALLIPGCHYVRATFREACGLVASADVYVRSESGLVHAAAALDIPTITPWGGCIPWSVLGGHPRQIGVGVDRSTPGGCGAWRPCHHCQTLMAAITPSHMLSALSMVVDARSTYAVS